MLDAMAAAVARQHFSCHCRCDRVSLLNFLYASLLNFLYASLNICEAL
jgi:hypothetical protein